MKNNSIIKGILMIVLTLSIVSLASAATTGDVVIRYSSENSEGTGIAISQLGLWVPGNPANLSTKLPHTVKYYIDNKAPNTNARVHIRLKMDGMTLADYYVNISGNSTHSSTIGMDLTNLECTSRVHTVYLDINAVYDCPPDTDGCLQDSNMNNNFAQRNFVVFCSNLSVFCGDGIVNQAAEQCDLGENNGKVCNASYGKTCTYCSSICKLTNASGGYCGDGILDEEHESCDDGNKFNDDGCSNTCKTPTDIIVEHFVPLVWQCDNRIVYDDATEPGRVSMDGEEMVERTNNYAFEGEQIKWLVLVMDKNGIDKVKDVYVTLDDQIEANCVRINEAYKPQTEDSFTQSLESVIVNLRILPSCNARILEEQITEFDEETMAYYMCTLTVETSESMHGEYHVTVEAEDLDGIIGDMDEEEFWFFNPYINLGIDGEIEFQALREGTIAYSTPVIVTNEAEYSSGVILDMFISGTDFYDSSNSGAKCPTTNQLSLERFNYYATSGAYSTHQDIRSDSEGYVPIKYGIGFNDPTPFYKSHEIIQSNVNSGGYYAGNLLTPSADMTLTFRLNLPEPCNGDFDTGQIYFWGEAV